jgi:tetratricopeptide (TPR) repeat protein
MATGMVREGKGRMPVTAQGEGRRAAELLEAKIRQSGVSIRSIEERVGWGQATLNQVLSGRTPIRFSHVAAVCEVLGLPLADFYRELAESQAEATPQEAATRAESHADGTALSSLPPSPESPLSEERGGTKIPLQDWELCEALLRKSFESRFSDLKRMLDLAESAVGVARHIRPEEAPSPEFLADLRARAFAELGNAYRLNLRFHDAEESFARARAFLEEGSGDPSLNAQVLDLEASFRTSQRRLNEAVSLLNQVHDLYLEIGDLHLAGRALISKGIYTRCNGDPREAVSLLERGLDLLDRERDPRLIGIGKCALVDAFADCGQYREASRLLFRSGLRETFVAEPLLQLKARWVEGKVHAGLGRLGRAERAFRDTRQEYMQRGQIYDAALVGLDMAAVWLRQGRAEEVRSLAEEIYAVFKDLGVEPEAAKALRFVQEACRREEVTVPMIEGVRTFLERLPWQPGLRFEPALFAP